MRILGIDPGFATIGFGLVEADRGQAKMVTYGAITTPAGLPLSRRLYQIATDRGATAGASCPTPPKSAACPCTSTRPPRSSWR